MSPRLAAVPAPEPLATLTPRLVTRTSVETLLADYELTQTKIEQLKAKKDILAKDILALVPKYGKKFETPDGLVATIVESSNTSIDKQKLVELGVKATVIEKATRVTPYSYPKVTRKKKVEDL